MLGDFHKSKDVDISDRRDEIDFSNLVKEVAKLPSFSEIAKIPDYNVLTSWEPENGFQGLLWADIWNQDPFARIMLFLNDMQLKKFKEKDDFFKYLLFNSF